MDRIYEYKDRKPMEMRPLFSIATGKVGVKAENYKDFIRNRWEHSCVGLKIFKGFVKKYV